MDLNCFVEWTPPAGLDVSIGRSVSKGDDERYDVTAFQPQGT